MSEKMAEALYVLRILSPALVALSALSLLPAKPAPPPENSPITSVVVRTNTPRRALLLSFLSLISLSFLADGLTFVVFTILSRHWDRYAAVEIGAIIGIIAYGGLAIIGAWKDVKGVDIWAYGRLKGTITIALLLDIAQVVLLGLAFHKVTVRNVLHLAFPAFRVLLLIPITFALYNPRVSYTPIHSHGHEDTLVEGTPSQSTFLLPPPTDPASTGLNPVSGKYGTFNNPQSYTAPTTRATTPIPSEPRPSASSSKKAKEEVSYDPSWSEIGRRLSHLTPYLWPSGSKPLQFIAGICILLLAVGRVVNLALPWTLGKLVGVFEDGVSANKTAVWYYLGSYIVLRFLQSNGGLAALRDSLWAPVMQYSDRAMSQMAFEHLLNLSLSFHIRRKTGEVLRILDRGAAINHIFELILFNIIPAFVDIIIALVVFAIWYEWTLTVVVFLVMVAYVTASIMLTRWRTKIRRQMNDRDIITRGIHTDCLLNYETVKYFGGEAHEAERYRDAVNQYQALEYRVIVSLNLLNLVQNFITTLGLLVGCIIMARRVVDGRSKAADFVAFIFYLAQLYGPLNMLGTIYRSINTSLVDTEKLLTLLNEPKDVEDRPGAPDLVVRDGVIEFENVSFSYDGKTPALSNVSFTIPKGSSFALVGESGSGKSTILRLLYRFYDLKEGQGRILIDGQDIRDVTQASLRKAIGVVPQDSVLFNSSIEYNIGYGKFGASTAEIVAAAQAAHLHDRILSFPEGYDTKVGERGVRLSGGEKQRVAIARTLLKNPPVLLLDEATSALDTSTEKDIQKAFEGLVEGRTSLSIAHRLSTIASSDVILVLRDGQIVEAGTHAELLGKEGAFAVMWQDQISGSDAGTLSKRQSRAPVEGYDLPDNDQGASGSGHGGDDNEGGFGETVVHAAGNFLPTTLIAGSNDAPTQDPAIAFPTEGASRAPTLPPKESKEPLAFPQSSFAAPEAVSFPGASTSTSTPGPISFPGADNDSTREAGSIRGAGGVTFEAGAHPTRDETPEPVEAERRKRTASQNFQRIARRISITTRRTGSDKGSGLTMPNLPNMNLPNMNLPNMNLPNMNLRDMNLPNMNLGNMNIPGFRREGSTSKKAEKEKEREGSIASAIPDAVVTASPDPSVSSEQQTAATSSKLLQKRKKSEKRKTLI